MRGYSLKPIACYTMEAQSLCETEMPMTSSLIYLNQGGYAGLGVSTSIKFECGGLWAMAGDFRLFTKLASPFLQTICYFAIGTMLFAISGLRR